MSSRTFINMFVEDQDSEIYRTRADLHCKMKPGRKNEFSGKKRKVSFLALLQILYLQIFMHSIFAEKCFPTEAIFFIIFVNLAIFFENFMQKDTSCNFSCS